MSQLVPGQQGAQQAHRMAHGVRGLGAESLLLPGKDLGRQNPQQKRNDSATPKPCAVVVRRLCGYNVDVRCHLILQFFVVVHEKNVSIHMVSFNDLINIINKI